MITITILTIILMINVFYVYLNMCITYAVYIYVCVCECKSVYLNHQPTKSLANGHYFAWLLQKHWSPHWGESGWASAVVDQWPTSLLVSSAGPTKWWTFKAFLWNPKQISSLWLVSDESRNFHMQMILRIKYTSVWTTEVLAWCSVPTFRQRPHQHPTFSRSPMRCDFDGATW